VNEVQLKPPAALGSGGVRRFELAGGKVRVTQITTFCPNVIGPGPIHLYLIDCGALLLLDAGIPTHTVKDFFYKWRNQHMPAEVDQLAPDHSYQEFLDALKVAGYATSDLDALVISHGHPDHFLMAQTVLNGHKASVSAHIMDTPLISNPWGLFNNWFARVEQMRGAGLPTPWSIQPHVKEEIIRGLDLESEGLAVVVDSPIFNSGPLMVSGSEVEDLEVIHLPGHSPGSIGLLVRTGGECLLLSGDVLLNPITPHPENLLAYLRTLRALSQLDAVTLVLPAHGNPITDLEGRVKFIQEHHRNRLRLTYERCVEPKSVWEIATSDHYFELYVDSTRYNPLAGMEVLVHMELLNMVYGLQRTDVRNGVHYFRNSSEPFEQVYGRVMELVEDGSTNFVMRY
jgi:glyoxylase-like metal-dependent hydrolase (beta-lactamase superfamily II)